jgi:hypothetical protein
MGWELPLKWLWEVTFGGFRRRQLANSGDWLYRGKSMGKKVSSVDMFILFIRSDAFMYIVFGILKWCVNFLLEAVKYNFKVHPDKRELSFGKHIYI